jgi:tetratricopeptide (TPR) repeat protein
MIYPEIQKKYRDILEAVMSNRLLDALQILRDLSEQVNSSDIQSHYQSLMDTYRNMLKYSFELVPDPERTRIYNKLQQNILELSDDISDSWIRKVNLFERASQTASIEHFEATYFSDPVGTILKLSKEAGESDLTVITGDGSERSETEKLVNQLFNWLWLKNRFTGEISAFYMQLIDADDIHWNTKALMISSLTLSQLRHFDREKIFLLFDMTHHVNEEIRQRAIIGLFLAIMVSQRRIPLYQDIMDRLKSIPDDHKFQERMLAVLIQYIRSTETEKITQKIQQEIVPEVLKIKSELEEKLKLDELLSKENFDEKNPEWQNFFKDAPDVYQKLEQFSKLQIEGSDVFMGAFALLKQFDFFKETTNWFLPFNAGNQNIKKVFQSQTNGIDMQTFLEGLEKSTVLCNSDKFSFCLNIQHMPDEQRKMMVDLFNMEINSMNEAMEDEFKMDPESKNKIINTQYFQDLYRFFKLHPHRKEYDNVFENKIDLFGSATLSTIYNDSRLIKNLAEFYFAKDFYSEALSLFKWLNESEMSFELLEKLGYCYQKQGRFNNAIEHYKQAELFEKDKIWLQKKLGYCYRKTGNYESAIDYYKQIVMAEPTDMNNLAYLGQLYLDTEDYENALKYYYKVEYEKPDNVKVCRPIAWCSFVQGKYDISMKYFFKVIANKPGKSDYLNIGHCYWALGLLEKALDSYREAIRLSGNDQNWFRQTFYNDSKYFKKSGISDLDVSLMVDYVLLFM